MEPTWPLILNEYNKVIKMTISIEGEKRRNQTLIVFVLDEHKNDYQRPSIERAQ